MTVTTVFAVVIMSVPLAAAALCADRLLALLRRPRRHVWTAALLLTVLLPLTAPWRTARQERAEAGTTQVQGAAHTRELVESAMAGTAAWRQRLESYEGTLTVGWGAASTATALFYACGMVVLRRRRRHWRTQRLSDTEVLVSRSLGPAVTGLRSPRVVVPEWVLRLDAATVDFVLRHELEHIRVRDPWRAHASLLAAILMPWNPMVWWTLRRLRLAMEIDCDARVIAATTGAGAIQDYGHVLLTLAGRIGRQPILPLAAIARPRSAISRRLSAMAAPPPRRPRTQAAATALAAPVCLLAACSAGVPDAPVSPDESAATRVTADGQSDEPVTADAGDVVDVDTSGLVRPRAVFRPRPVYTPRAMREKIQGTVWLESVVTPEGRVRDVRVVRSLDRDHGLDSNAVAAARQWVFEPGMLDGRPVPVRVDIEMEFRIR